MDKQEKENLKKIIDKFMTNFNDLGYEVNNELRKAILLAEFSEKNVIISGSAGTGKSTFIELFKANTKKNIVVLAPTGVAAVNVKGVTIHSFFKLAFGIVNKYAVIQSNRELVNKIDVMIIDEISMVRADLMDAIDYQLRVLTGNSEKSFGGIKIIAVGDLFQLPPIVKRGSPDERYIRENFYSPWFFSAPDIGDFTVVEMTKIYRQNDEKFTEILNKIRIGKQKWDDLKFINSRVIKEEDFGDNYIYLSTTNKVADMINSNKLKEIQKPSKHYYATITGDFPFNSFPTSQNLELKVGAQVMMMRNGKNWYNGQIGTVISLSDFSLDVLLDTTVYSVSKETWNVGDYELKNGKVQIIEKGSFTQYPLKLAYAITIHKSQSKTYDKVYIDLGNGAFSAGQTYVALSRCKTLNGIGLKYKLDKRDIIVDKTLKENFINI